MSEGFECPFCEYEMIREAVQYNEVSSSTSDSGTNETDQNTSINHYENPYSRFKRYNIVCPRCRHSTYVTW